MKLLNQEVKHALETIHLNYLVATFNLQLNHPSLDPNGIRPDFFTREPDNSNPRFCFELKSRIFPYKNTNRYQTDYEWWRMEMNKMSVSTRSRSIACSTILLFLFRPNPIRAQILTASQAPAR